MDLHKNSPEKTKVRLWLGWSLKELRRLCGVVEVYGGEMKRKKLGSTLYEVLGQVELLLVLIFRETHGYSSSVPM